MRDNEDAGGDAWERMMDSMWDAEGGAADHGAREEGLLAGCDERVAIPLTHIPTGRLKAALLTAAVHMVKCGGEAIGVTAAGVRAMERSDVLLKILEVHAKSEDDSQMLAIAIEHASH